MMRSRIISPRGASCLRAASSRSFASTCARRYTSSCSGVFSPDSGSRSIAFDYTRILVAKRGVSGIKEGRRAEATPKAFSTNRSEVDPQDFSLENAKIHAGRKRRRRRVETDRFLHECARDTEFPDRVAVFRNARVERLDAEDFHPFPDKVLVVRRRNHSRLTRFVIGNAPDPRRVRSTDLVAENVRSDAFSLAELNLVVGIERHSGPVSSFIQDAGNAVGCLVDAGVAFDELIEGKRFVMPFFCLCGRREQGRFEPVDRKST